MRYRRSCSKVIILVVLVGPRAFVAQPAIAAPTKSVQQGLSKQTVAQQIALFNSGNLQQAALCGYEVLRSDPGNSLARYYYAQTLYKLNRNADAKSQFAECYRKTSDLKMKANCYDALKALASQPSTAVTAAQSIKTPDAAKASLAARTTETGKNSTTVTENSSNTSAKSSTNEAEFSTHDPALAARKLQVMIDGAADIAAKRKQLAIEIQDAKDRAAEELNGIEQYFEKAVLVNNRIARVDRYENPEYSKVRDRTQRELQTKIEALNADFKRREAEILADCRARGAVYDEVRPALKTQQKAGTSQIQLMPQNTNGFVRHYVNYDGNDPVSLKARQGELTNSNLPVGVESKKSTKSALRTNNP